MNQPPDYQPPEVWVWAKDGVGPLAKINRPTAGPIYNKKLPTGRQPLQLYALGSPNGVKVTVMLEELLELGYSGAGYDAWHIDIMEGEQFGSGFVAANPNSKIPALLDYSTPDPTRIFESGAILVYLAEKFATFLPAEPAKRAECFSWVFWQVASAPFLGGGFGHFYAMTPFKIKYCIDRFTMEVKRQLDVLDRHLSCNEFMLGEYSIADMAIWPWYGDALANNLYDAAKFLDLESYPHVRRWHRQISRRAAVQRGRSVEYTKF